MKKFLVPLFLFFAFTSYCFCNQVSDVLVEQFLQNLGSTESISKEQINNAFHKISSNKTKIVYSKESDNYCAQCVRERCLFQKIERHCIGVKLADRKVKLREELTNNLLWMEIFCKHLVGNDYAIITLPEVLVVGVTSQTTIPTKDIAVIDLGNHDIDYIPTHVITIANGKIVRCAKKENNNWNHLISNPRGSCSSGSSKGRSHTLIFYEKYQIAALAHDDYDPPEMDNDLDIPDVPDNEVNEVVEEELNNQRESMIDMQGSIQEEEPVIPLVLPQTREKNNKKKGASAQKRGSKYDKYYREETGRYHCPKKGCPCSYQSGGKLGQHFKETREKRGEDHKKDLNTQTKLTFSARAGKAIKVRSQGFYQQLYNEKTKRYHCPKKGCPCSYRKKSTLGKHFNKMKKMGDDHEENVDEETSITLGSRFGRKYVTKGFYKQFYDEKTGRYVCPKKGCKCSAEKGDSLGIHFRRMRERGEDHTKNTTSRTKFTFNANTCGKKVSIKEYYDDGSKRYKCPKKGCPFTSKASGDLGRHFRTVRGRGEDHQKNLNVKTKLLFRNNMGKSRRPNGYYKQFYNKKTQKYHCPEATCSVSVKNQCKLGDHFKKVPDHEPTN